MAYFLKLITLIFCGKTRNQNASDNSNISNTYPDSICFVAIGDWGKIAANKNK